MVTRIEISAPSKTLNSAPEHAQRAYLRRRQDLKRLLPVWPSEADDLSLTGRRHIVRCLERALRVERRRSRTGHWAYNISRHAALIAIYKQERAALIAFQISTAGKTQKRPPKGGRF